jgi:hypothetical protein
MVLSTTAALAEFPGPAVNLSGERIRQISMVVKDSEKVAKRFSDIFGPSWEFFEFRPLQIKFRGITQSDECTLKLAIGNCGGLSFKLVQPVSGQSSYMEFLRKHGEGFFSIGLGPLANHDRVVDALSKAGICIEMQGDAGDGSQFNVLETVADYGCRHELASNPRTIRSTCMRQTGRFVPRRSSVVDMDPPVVSGGRQFTHIGLVVNDHKRVAHRYHELIGIGGWQFVHVPSASKYAIYGEPLAKDDLVSTVIGTAVTNWCDIQIELLAPTDLRPGGIHRVFLDNHGNGLQHLMMSPLAGDNESVMEALGRAGFNREMETTVHFEGRGGTATYVGMEEQLGGFVLEFIVEHE